MFDPITILAGLAPLGVELGKAAISKWFGTDNFKPASIDDWLKMRQSDIDFFKSINEAGGNNQTYQWVEAVKQLQRPIVASTVLLTWSACHLAELPDTTAIDNFASAIGFYLFGDRTLFYVRKAVK